MMIYTPPALNQAALHLLLAERERRRPPADYASDVHKSFFDSHEPEVLLSGWMGAGKSRVLCEKAWWVARNYPGVTVALFRKIKSSIEPTTERTFLRDVVDLRQIAQRNKSENWYELTNGSRIYFLGLDPDPLTGVPSKVGSLDLGWAGVDEAVEITEGDWIMLLGRLRDPRMGWHQLAAATNPGPPTHWLRQRMTSAGRSMFVATSNKFLAPDYLEMLAGLPDTAQGQRLGRGLWVAAEGAIYYLPDGQIRFPDPSIVWKRTVAGIDWGFVHAFACEVVGQSGSGSMAALHELYERGKTLDDLIPRLLSMQVQFGIEAFYADPSEPQNILTLQRAGLVVIPATNDVLPGISAVTDALRSGLTIAPTCSGLLGELPAYTWLSDRNGQQERPVKVGDDACDALRYAVMALRTNVWGTYGSGNA
jgi:phage terminase large subunit